MHSEPLCQDQLFDMLKILSQYDLKESMQVNSMPTYMMIPFDIQCRLFEACNYIGLGKNDPYIQPLYNLLEERERLFDESDISRKLIWTVDGVESFLKTGKTGDYFEPFEGAPSQQKWTQKSFKKRNESQYFVNLLKPTALIPRFA